MANRFKDSMYVGEVHNQSFNHATAAANLGTTVSSATWYNSDDSVLTLSNETIVSGNPEAVATALAPGFSTIVLETVMADTTRIKSSLTIKVSALADS